MFTLYATPLSANGRKVLSVAHHLGLHPDVRIVDVYKGEGRSKEYLAINPTGKIPTLVEDDWVLWESNAILQYMSEAHADDRLGSKHPRRRADIARWLYWESAHWQPAFVPVLSAFVGRLIVPQLRDLPEVVVDWNEPKFEAIARFLDGHLQGRAHLVEGALTLADFSVAGMMTYARKASFPFDAYPNIARWYAGVEALESWRSSAVEPWG